MLKDDIEPVIAIGGMRAFVARGKMGTFYPVKTSGSSYPRSGQVTAVARDDVGERPVLERRFQASHPHRPRRTSKTGYRVVTRSIDLTIRLLGIRIQRLVGLCMLACNISGTRSIHDSRFMLAMRTLRPRRVLQIFTGTSIQCPGDSDEPWYHCYRNSLTEFARVGDCVACGHRLKAGRVVFKLEHSRLLREKLEPHCV